METKRLSSCAKEDHGNRIIESQRNRMTQSTEHTHMDHIADRGDVSMSHCNMVHKPCSRTKKQEQFQQQAGMNKDMCRWRVEQLLVCGMLSNATTPSVGRTQLRTPHTRFKCESHITHTTITALFRFGFFLPSRRRASMEFEIVCFIQEWYRRWFGDVVLAE